MEGCCLDRFIKQGNVSSFYDNAGGDVHQSNETIWEFHLHLSDSNLQNAATTTAHLYTLLANVFEKKQMISGRTTWDQTYGCANQYRCSIDYYLMSYLSTSYKIVLDRVLDTPGHGKDVVDGFNALQKRYLATCLRMISTPEKHKIDSKRMCVEAMTENDKM